MLIREEEGAEEGRRRARVAGFFGHLRFFVGTSYHVDVCLIGRLVVVVVVVVSFVSLMKN